MDGYTNTNSKLKVINQTGKVMMDVNFNNSLDVSALSTGTYYLKIYENNRVFMKRFTKL
ncbi:MAG: T9SS C-terminal target domain-containing protein [Bacteroidetes bacterium]|nr:T9SS C-terminal target domain-containing protein [Bacteroidota bacterium]